EAGGARRLRNESFFSAPQLKRDSLGRGVHKASVRYDRRRARHLRPPGPPCLAWHLSGPGAERRSTLCYLDPYHHDRLSGRSANDVGVPPSVPRLARDSSDVGQRGLCPVLRTLWRDSGAAKFVGRPLLPPM